MTQPGTPRERSIATVQHLARETERVMRRLAVLKDQLDDLHHAWGAFAGNSTNEGSQTVLLHLADASHHAQLAAQEASEAQERMERYSRGI